MGWNGVEWGGVRWGGVEWGGVGWSEVGWSEVEFGGWGAMLTPFRCAQTSKVCATLDTYDVISEIENIILEMCFFQ
jgi:hypothetical protein